MLRCCFLVLASVLITANATRAVDDESDKVLDRFVGVWRNDVSRKDAEHADGQKLTSEEVTAKALKNRYLIHRELNPQSNVKFLWFMAYDPLGKNYVWTFFNTQGLYGTEWRGTWDEATATLTSKSSDAPSTWSSQAVNRFVNKDTVKSSSWMKDDQGQPIFEMTSRKTRQPDAAAEKVLAAWRADSVPAPALPPELQLLEPLAGKWDVTATMKKAEWTPEETSLKSKVERTWILNHLFLQDTSTDEKGDESLALFTYDPKQKQYRSWWFNSEGHTSKSTGQRAALGNTIDWKSMAPDGKITTSSVQFTDADHHDWSVRIVDAAGKVYLDAVWKCVRAKP